MKTSSPVAAMFCINLVIAHISGFAEIKPATDAPAPLSPAESVQTFRLPPGFRAELIASEPLINEPSGVCWDEQGRLFVSELHGYNVDGWYDIQELNKTGQLDTSVRRIRGTKEGRGTPTVGFGSKIRADTSAQWDYFANMSKAEILEQLPRLTPAERQEVRLKLAALDGEQWLDADDPLTDTEKALLDARLAAYEKDPDAGSSWEEVESRIRARLKA